MPGIIRSSTNEDRAIWVGKPVKFTDSHGVVHHGLIENVWGMDDDGPQGANVLYVSADETQTDQYGRQKMHATSCTRKDYTAAPGYHFELVA